MVLEERVVRESNVEPVLEPKSITIELRVLTNDGYSAIPVCITQTLEGVHDICFFPEGIAVTPMIPPVDTNGSMWTLADRYRRSA